MDSNTATSLIPTVETDLFVGSETKRFAVGIVAVGDNPVSGREAEHAAYLRLRGNVYAHEMHYMPVEDLRPDGTESDEDDKRSVHLGLFENHPAGGRAVGAMRMILKSTWHPHALPIEHHYPEAFSEAPASLASVEISRLIGRHETQTVQNGLKWPLFAAGVAWLLEHEIPDVFGAVEATLETRLKVDGVPVTTLAPGKYVNEYNAVKAPIRIDLAGLGATISADQPDLLEAMKGVERAFVYSGDKNGDRR